MKLGEKGLVLTWDGCVYVCARRGIGSFIRITFFCIISETTQCAALSLDLEAALAPISLRLTPERPFLLPLVLMKDIALREMSLDPDLLTRTTLLPLIPESKLLLVLVLVTDTV
jgi:hypothetical protein